MGTDLDLPALAGWAMLKGSPTQFVEGREGSTPYVVVCVRRPDGTVVKPEGETTGVAEGRDEAVSGLSESLREYLSPYSPETHAIAVRREPTVKHIDHPRLGWCWAADMRLAVVRREDVAAAKEAA